MKKLLPLIAALTLACSASLAYAADAPPNRQQHRMATCNQEAAGMTGDQRKAFMKECLRAQKETRQERMKTCNRDVGDRKGEERKAFMKECLSNK